MSPTELAGEVLLSGFNGTSSADPSVGALGLSQLGGVIVGPRNWTEAATGTALVEKIRNTATSNGLIPPLVTVAQEGGNNRALADLPPSRTELQMGESPTQTTPKRGRPKLRRHCIRLASISTCSRSPTSPRSTARWATARSPTTPPR